MKLWKRLLAIPIAASLVMGLLPAPALAEDTAHSHPICGEAHTDIGDHTGDNCKDATWTAWDGTSTITYDTNNTAYVYLEKDATRESRLEVKAGYTLYLCLNGQKLESSLTSSASQGMSQVINVSNGAKFILCDCKGGGTITHSSGAKGKGVRVGGSDPAAATFSMYGGTISGNHADDPRSGAGGAGVEIQNGTFKMYGGTINDWKSNDTKHWKEYACCGAHAEEAAHSGGTATCQNKAVCSTCNKPYGDLGSHVPASTWSKDTSGHWHACQTPNCNEQLAFAAHTPGPAATEDAPQLCTVCSYELAPALEHTHVWGAWISNGDGTHTRTCAKDGSHTETNACSGGIATCQNSAICSVCNTAYGAKDMTNHTGGTEVRGSVEATTSTEGYTGDTYCKGCDTKLADGKTIPKKDSGSSGGNSTGGSSSGGTSGGTGSGSSGGNTTPSTSVTVPVSGEEKTIRVDSTVSSTTATIEDIDLSKLNTVIGNDVKTGVVTIDFSVLEKQIDTVKLPANVIKQIADAVKDPSNDAESLSIVLTDGTSIEFDEKALSKKTAQTNQTDITISIKRTTDSALSALQQQAVGSQPAWDIKLTSGGKNISDMGGVITLHTPYELRSGEQSNGIVVYYVDENGNRESCETSYDPVKKLISWKTSHLSVYMIGYDENRVTPDTDTEDQSALNGSQVSKLKLPILLATGKGGNRKITISWRSYEDADGYDCYWSYCDGKRSYKKLATVKAAKDRVTSRRLANNRRYKYFVAAYKLIDGKKVYIAKSNTLHVALKDAKATNAKKVTVNQTNVRLKAGDTFVIRSRTRLENTNKKELLHAAAYRYYTSDQSVASVSKTGKIKALKSGTCVIYVVANNGVYGTIKVTVN